MSALQHEINNQRRIHQPFTMVIFGASGDLTERKLVPALYHLASGGHLPHQFAVIGMARRGWTDEFLREQMRKAVVDALGDQNVDETVWRDFAKRLFYVQGDATDAASFERLEKRIQDISNEQQAELSANRLYYLATLPSLYPELITRLGELEQSRSNRGWCRVIVEKPFGRDLQSAVSLNRLLARYFDENQVYRIDHYLGKETVQNIMVMRFANSLFEPVWNRRYIDNVQITVSETLGVGHRGAYYEEAGAIRDMVQNHLLQILALVAMEPPGSFAADAVRNEKVKVLNSIPVPDIQAVAQNTIRAQYTSGFVDGQEVAGYLDEPHIAPDSRTETYVAWRLTVENWRWADVPFYLQTGKRLKERTSRVAVFFKRPPDLPFQRSAVEGLHPNCLILNLQPDEGITLSLRAKVPGPQIRIKNVNMDFTYKEAFKERSPDAYEHLLLEAMAGDTTMFTRDDEVEAAWKLITAVTDSWENQAGPLHTYPAGSTGPKEKHSLLEPGHVWLEDLND